MSFSVLQTLNCVESSKSLLLKENDSTYFNIPSLNRQGSQKIAFSLKEKKIIQKELSFKRSLKSLRKVSARNLNEKQNIKETCKPPKLVKTLQIYPQISIEYQAHSKPAKTKMDSSIISFCQVETLSSASIIHKQNLRSTQQMQLCGAQSVVFLQHTRLKKQFSNQSTQCKFPGSENSSILLISGQKLGLKELLRQGKSQISLSSSIFDNNKIYTSVVMPEKLKISKIDEQDSDKSQSLRQISAYSLKNTFQESESPEFQKATPRASTFAMTNSGSQSFRSKVLTKKNLKDMQIRSTQSIKEEQSVDEFSQVLNKSCLTPSKRKISLTRLIKQNKLYHEE